MERLDLRRFTLFGLLAYGFAASDLPSQDAGPARRASSSFPPQPGLAKPYTEFFRQLLKAPAPERAQLLAGKPQPQRQVFEDKLREYEALPEPERELRLRTLDLRYYLGVLLRVPASNRLERLASIPEPDRRMVEERLRYWDRCSPEVQQDLLENEKAVRLLVGLDISLANPRIHPTNAIAGRSAQFERALQLWKSLPVEKRQAIRTDFQRMFTLTEKEKDRLLHPLSEPERKLMERTLAAFTLLPDSQREACIASFRKFADLSAEERVKFLTSAARWEAMSAEDRQAWRRLVTRVPAPLPPLPPITRSALPVPSLQAQSTNQTNQF